MKTLLIFILALFGFGSLYILNPSYIDCPFIGGVLLSGIGIGCLVGSMFKQRKTKKKLRASRLINKSILNDKAKFMETKSRMFSEIQQLQNKIFVLQTINNDPPDVESVEIQILKAENYDLIKKCENVLSLQGNFKQLQKKYNHLKATVKEQDKMIDSIGINLSEKV
jgi:hypothetical protein